MHIYDKKSYIEDHNLFYYFKFARASPSFVATLLDDGTAPCEKSLNYTDIHPSKHCITSIRRN